MAEKSYIQKYREGLIESIKVAGQLMIDKAEDLAGNVDHMSNFDISISFDQERTGSIPELTITKSFFPPEKECFSLMDIYRNGKPEEKKTCENCDNHARGWGCILDEIIVKDDADDDCPKWEARRTYEPKEDT